MITQSGEYCSIASVKSRSAFQDTAGWCIWTTFRAASERDAVVLRDGDRCVTGQPQLTIVLPAHSFP